MDTEPNAATNLSAAAVNACWRRIGVQGDGSCPELTQHVHCRNCPVYSDGAMQLFDREVAADDIVGQTSLVAQPKRLTELTTQSIVIFRIGSEWLALPTACVTEFANILPIHTLPHRASGVILGVVNVRGELRICVSLGHVLGMEPTGPDTKARRRAYPRLLLIRHDQARVGCPVDEVHGIHRFHASELQDVPATVARAAGTYSKAVLPWREHSVGLLDDGLLFRSLLREMG